MSLKKMIYIGITLSLLAVVYFGWRLTSRNAYESAEYAMIKSEGPFEIRDYPDLLLASTSMQFKSQGDDGSFMRLFRYISGTNDKEQKIAMTVPVFMETESQNDDGNMGFVIPIQLSEGRIPLPSNPDVKIRKRSGGRFAVIRFTGRFNDHSVLKAKCKLRKWIEDKNLIGDADAECAGYDPPWTPGPFRRNEILIRLN